MLQKYGFILWLAALMKLLTKEGMSGMGLGYHTSTYVLCATGQVENLVIYL